MTERTRNRETGPTNGTYLHMRQSSAGSLPYVYTWQTHVIDHDVEVMNDVVVPEYRKRIAAGEIINNPCKYERSSKTTTGGYQYRAVSKNSSGYPIYTSDGDGSLTEYFVSLMKGAISLKAPTPDGGSALEQSRNAALAAVDTTPYSFMEDAAEIRETLQFLRNPLGSLIKLGKSFRKDARKRQRTLKYRTEALADVWLSYRFGVMPLVRSAFDATEVCLNGIKRQPDRRTARGYGNHSENGDRLVLSNTLTCSEFWETETNCKSGIIYEVKNPTDSMPINLGFRLQDIPETAWAIVPLSFMVDRVLNISNFISGVRALADPNVRIITGFSTTKQSATQRVRAVSQNNSSYTITMSGDVVHSTSFKYERQVWAPSIRDAIPPLVLKNLVKDATSIADLLALSLRLFK